MLPDPALRCAGVPDTSPTARALRALELLQARPGITADRARRRARRDRAGRAALRRDPARGRHPGGVGARPLRRLPGRPRAAAAAAGLQRDRGARPGDGGARRAPRPRRPRRPGRQRARQDHPGAAGGGRRAGRGGTAYGGTRARPWRGPARPHHHDHPGPGLWRATAAAARLPHRVGPRSGRPRSSRGRWWSGTAAGTCCAGAATSTPAAPTGWTGSPPRRCWTSAFEPPAGLDPVQDLEEHLARRLGVRDRGARRGLGRGGRPGPAPPPRSPGRRPRRRLPDRRQHQQPRRVRREPRPAALPLPDHRPDPSCARRPGRSRRRTLAAVDPEAAAATFGEAR